jgi:hypothetical protein
VTVTVNANMYGGGTPVVMAGGGGAGNAPARDGPLIVIPVGGAPAVRGYLNGPTPPVVMAYVPHTFTQPASTTQSLVQGPLTTSRWATLIDLWTPAAPPAESSTLTTKVKPPAALGVPETVPPDDRLSPVGIVPPPTDQW